MTFHDAVRPFAGITLADVPSAGGKGASLGELTRAGIAVPPGFVVTTEAFRAALRALDPGGACRAEIERLDPGDLDAVSRVTADVRGRIERAPLPDGLRTVVADRYRELPGDVPAPVAVRSSATGEDGADASFAGLQDTHLWVCGEDAVLEHVRRCWASLYTPESVTYRRRRGMPEEQQAMGVVVQRMVDPRCSGVMFTRSPSTGDRSVVTLEAGWGLGSAIVSGEVTPDRFVVSKVTGEIVRRAVSSKLRRHRRHPSGTGVLDEEVPAELRDVPCLTDDEIAALVALARRIEDHYGTPQDIEWAIAADLPDGENVLVLQSRPETVWARREATPVATPKPRAFDHVLDLLGGRGPGR